MQVRGGQLYPHPSRARFQAALRAGTIVLVDDSAASGTGAALQLAIKETREIIQRVITAANQVYPIVFQISL